MSFDDNDRESGISNRESMTSSVFDTAQLVKIKEGLLKRPRWTKVIPRVLVATDTVAVSVGVGAAVFQEYLNRGAVGPTTWLVSVSVLLAWLIVLRVADTRDVEVVGYGPEEFIRVFNSTFVFFGLIAIACFLTEFDLARSFVAVSLPVGLGLLMGFRYLVRRRLSRMRDAGDALFTTIIVGGKQGATYLINQLGKNPRFGYKLIGACVLENHLDEGKEIAGIPILGTTEQVFQSVLTTGANSVIITGVDVVTPDVVKKLSWDLEKLGVQIIVAPSIMDVAGPRIHTKPVAGLPLLHVEMPGYSGPQHILKRCFDIVASSILIFLLSPVMLAIASLVKFTSSGPVIFKQQRIGLNGESFKMWKFRSMVVDAEVRLKELRDKNEGNGLLFKMKDDPRITNVGKVLRRFSLDELPQLFNVLGGSMSLVGPRPPLKTEVEQYDDEIGRRLLVKPGVTGLWQVSGRSDLSLEESVRLDLYYVENWTVAGDILILLKTVKAVFSKDGAY